MPGLRSLVTLVLCATVLGSCVMFRGPAESFFRVRGKIDVPSSTQGCWIELHRAPGGQVIQKRDIDKNFDATFVIAPRPGTYFLTVSCPGSLTEYRSTTYTLKEHQAQPLDLGTITLKRVAER